MTVLESHNDVVAKRLEADFSSRSIAFNPRLLHLKFLVKVALEEVFLRVASTILPLLHAPLRLAIALTRQHIITSSVFKLGASFL
jgi:hypothetical protein